MTRQLWRNTAHYWWDSTILAGEAAEKGKTVRPLLYTLSVFDSTTFLLQAA